MRRALIAAVACTAAILACASPPPPRPADPIALTAPAEAPAPLTPPPTIEPERSCPALLAPDRLRRSDLLRALDRGLGRWLGGISVDAHLERGRFRGWTVRGLHAGDPCYEALDLRAGDIVTRINGRPLERPEEAHQVWTSLRTAAEIVVDYVRAGERRTLRITIVDQADAAAGAPR